jgi:hypothetical protein
MKILIAAGALCLSACALPSATGTAEQRVSIDGRTYQIGQLTNSTWIATPGGIGKLLAITPSSRRALQDAIAQTSGCKVTDSDLSREGLQLDAQVDCGSNLDPQGASRK